MRVYATIHRSFDGLKSVINMQKGLYNKCPKPIYYPMIMTVDVNLPAGAKAVRKLCTGQSIA